MKTFFQDYSDRRLSQKYLGVVDSDYYEWETQIFFDDAFELGENDEEQQARLSKVFSLVFDFAIAVVAVIVVVAR